MARKLRVLYPGAMYHVMNRGDRREPIFTDQEDPKPFLETLGQAFEKTRWLHQSAEAKAQRQFPKKRLG